MWGQGVKNEQGDQSLRVFGHVGLDGQKNERMLFFFQAQGLPCIFQSLGGERQLRLCPRLYDTENLDLFFGQDMAALDMNQHGTAFKAQSVDFLYLHASDGMKEGKLSAVVYSHHVAIRLLWESSSGCH